ncbi:MAG: relaxase/mobilization nuclease domain-containing protein [Pleurocapsa sp. CRU_1_2]|nr:relaxase/mobilization nuclease domain-containing protein [Pleurocapsa sp. CRU_1_2]
MIAKQVKGRGFRGCLNYIFSKPNSQILGGNMSGRNAPELATEFGFSRLLNPRVERAVYHASLSVRASEKLSDETWKALAQDYLEGMGFDANQYIAVKHNDTEHNHIHIVASRIRMTDGSCVSDSWDYVRSEKLIRELEKKYNLCPPEIKQPFRRSPTTGESRLRKRTGEESIREQIQGMISQLSSSKPTMPELIEQLREKG